MGNSRLRDPLRRPDFRRLALSYAVNELGDWLGIVALSVLVFDQTDSALATALLFMGTGFLPALLTPVVVARLERPPPRFVLPAIYAGEAAAFGALALLAGHFSLVAIVIVATIDGALALTARSLTRAVSATMLEPAGELRAGNAILNLAFTGGAAVGPAIAGVVVAAFGAQTALLLDAVSFYAIACILLTAKRLPHAEPEPGQLREQVRAGLGYIRGNLTLRRLLAAQTVALVFFSAVIPIEVIYAKETLGAGDTGYGLMLGSWGGGMVLGSVVFATLRRAPLPMLLFFSTLAIGAGYLGMAAAGTLAVACAAAALGGAGNGVQWVAVISSVQELTMQNMQARVIGVLESLGSATPGIGYLLGGLIASGFDPRATFLVAGIGVVAIAVIAAPLLGRKWPEGSEKTSSDGRPEGVDAGLEIMVELIPQGRSTRQGREMPTQSSTGKGHKGPIEPEAEVRR
ncbi:MAG TPA: MFS transporter [Solirubrobacterales bacterium]|nr:MFS transporter [Solirubrobacterales bacterium]